MLGASDLDKAAGCDRRGAGGQRGGASTRDPYPSLPVVAFVSLLQDIALMISSHDVNPVLSRTYIFIDALFLLVLLSRGLFYNLLKSTSRNSASIGRKQGSL